MRHNDLEKTQNAVFFRNLYKKHSFFNIEYCRGYQELQNGYPCHTNRHHSVQKKGLKVRKNEESKFFLV